jgi:hypothetical protein
MPYHDSIDDMIYNYRNNNSSNKKEEEEQNPSLLSTIRGASETLDALKQSQTGTHCIFIYPDLKTLRQILLHYTKVQLEDENQIVLILPYYQSTDMIRHILSAEEEDKYNINSGIDVRKYEKEGSLIIVDSLKGYFYYPQQQGDGVVGVHNDDDDNNNSNNIDLMSFVEVLLRHAERRHKDGVTILADMGSFYHYYYPNSTQRIINYEKSLPIRYDDNGMKLKGFCLYHQKDFEKRFTKRQQAKLLDSHSRSIMMMVANSD